ncbi:S4 domain-containing protein, partial [Azospirillum brasilense]|uniref:S4 domain-containing protein n=1 Tax=Azospirillum brasilense TaxID=192 RepID=UPI001FFFD2E5
VEAARTDLAAGVRLADLLAAAGLAESKGAARRLIRDGGARVNGTHRRGGAADPGEPRRRKPGWGWADPVRRPQAPRAGPGSVSRAEAGRPQRFPASATTCFR